MKKEKQEQFFDADEVKLNLEEFIKQQERQNEVLKKILDNQLPTKEEEMTDTLMSLKNKEAKKG